MSTPKPTYASLVGPLIGLYLPLPLQDDAANRRLLNASKLAKLWCSIYTEKAVDAAIAKHGGIKLPPSYARNLL